MVDANLEAARVAIREHALALPGAYEEFPWGERVVKVNKKVFAFLGIEMDPEGRMGMSVKLPESGREVLEQSFAKPTGYGLGKSGWVSLEFFPGDRPPVELLLRWVDESYRAVAPKRLLAGGAGAAGAAGRAGGVKKGAARGVKKAAKKVATSKVAPKKAAAKKAAPKKAAAKKVAPKKRAGKKGGRK